MQEKPVQDVIAALKEEMTKNTALKAKLQKQKQVLMRELKSAKSRTENAKRVHEAATQEIKEYYDTSRDQKPLKAREAARIDSSEKEVLGQ